MALRNLNLEGRVAVITGGGGVLCGYLAEKIAELGIRVAIIDLKKDAAEKVADKINQAGNTALAIEANVLNKKSLEEAEKIISDKWGKWNILINGAGGNHPKGTTSSEYLKLDDLEKQKNGIITFFDLDTESVNFVFDLNFLGTFLSVQVFAGIMINQKGAIIVNISSMNAFRPLTKIPAYSAAKAAVSNFTQWLAVYFSKVGIRVNAIAPGFFLTEQNRSLLLKEDGTFNSRAQKILNHTPLERFGTPEDLLGTLIWLINEKASGFVNGIVIPVDGGFSAFSGI
jgi:NAD(P)-dependent dehydrogenase (short-subunit alcohol dehydrogenase family)